jgi:hypothetical protein
LISMSNTGIPVLTRLTFAANAFAFALRAATGVFLAFEVGTFFGEFLNGFKVVRDVMGLLVSAVASNVENVLLLFRVLIVNAISNIRLLLNYLTGGGEEGARKIRKETEKELDAIEARMKGNIEAVKTAWIEMGNVDTSGAINRAKTMISSIEEYAAQITDLQTKLDAVKARVASGETTSAAEATILEEQIKALATKKKSLEGELSQIESTLDAKAKQTIVDIKVRVVPEEQIANQLQKIKTNINESKKNLGLDKFELIDGKFVSQDFSSKLAGLRVIMDLFLKPFEKDLRGTKERVTASTAEMVKGLQLIAEAAKSPEELALALKAVEDSGLGANREVELLAQGIRDKLEKTALTNLNNQFETLGGRIKEARENFDLMAQLQRDVATASLELRAVFSELGVNTQYLSGDLSFLINNLGRLEETASQQSAVSLEQYRAAIELARERYTGEITALKELADAKAQYIKDTVKDERASANQLKALDKETTRDRLKITKEYYDALVSEQKKRLDSFKDFANRIKDLDRDIYQTGLDRQDAIDNLRKKNMNDAEKEQVDRQRIEELALEASKAVYNKDYELAKDLTNKRIGLIESLAEYQGADADQIEGEVGTAYDDLIDIQERQREEAKKAAKEQYDAYIQVTEAVRSLAEQLQTMASAQVTQLKVELDQTSLANAVSQLQSAFANVVVTVQTSVQGAGTEIKKAAGGLISGPGTGTSDSIPMWGSNGEFMIRARAVSHYGMGLMSMINDMVLPKHTFGQGLAMGGPVGGGMGAKRPVTINIGGESFTTYADEGTGSRLDRVARVESLKKGSRPGVKKR